jgi:hypothetical protein
MGEIRRVIRNPSDIVIAATWFIDMADKGLAGGPVVVTLGREKRSTEQNARLWAMLTDVSNQVQCHGVSMSAEDWKHVFTAAQHQQRMVPGIDGGFVALGRSTSRMDKHELSELMELIAAFGAEHGVEFRDDEG